jgi:hypothetical protein
LITGLPKPFLSEVFFMPSRPRTDATSLFNGSEFRYAFTFIVLGFALLFGPSADHVEAIPAFARRYELPCHFCHDGYPKLSVLGEQFKERGYRLDEDITDPGDWWRSVPASVRATLRQRFEEGGDAETLGIARLVSAGSLGSRLSYWIDETETLDEGGFDRAGVDNAFLRVEILEDELYVRGGRFELDLPFTQARSPQLFAYTIYFANTGFEIDAIGSHQEGIELGGSLDERTRWSLAIVSGQNSESQESLSDRVGRFDGNLYGRLARRFGEGRVGAYAYWGRSVLARRIDPEGTEDGARILTWDNNLFRLGTDGAVYLRRAHVYGTALYGRNSNSFADGQHPGGTGEAASYFGGFAQLDFTVRDELVLSGRLDVLRSPPLGSSGPSETVVGFYPALKLWLHPRVRLAFELGFRNRDLPSRGAIHVEAVF